VLGADSDAERKYEKVTGIRTGEVVKTEFGKPKVRQVSGGWHIRCKRLAEQEQGKSFVELGYTGTIGTSSDHQGRASGNNRILGGQGKFGAALPKARLARTATSIKATVDKTHNRGNCIKFRYCIVDGSPHNVKLS